MKVEKKGILELMLSFSMKYETTEKMLIHFSPLCLLKELTEMLANYTLVIVIGFTISPLSNYEITQVNLISACQL